MKATVLRRLGLVVGGVVLLTLSACAGDSRTPAPRTAATEPRLLAEEYVEGDAVVQAINPVDRKVTLRGANMQSTTVQVPADVDLNRLKVGDTVRLGVFESLSVRVLPPGSAPLGATAAVGSTAPGQPQGRTWGQQVVVVNEVTAVDPVNHTVTLRGGDGQSRVVTVKDPEMQQRMRNLRVGDLVELTYSEVVAAKILPRT
jgi:hypothetical protein